MALMKEWLSCIHCGDIFKMKQREIADKTGLLQPHISKYLNGIMVPTYPNAKKMADAMGITVDTLYSQIIEKKMQNQHNSRE